MTSEPHSIESRSNRLQLQELPSRVMQIQDVYMVVVTVAAAILLCLAGLSR